MQPALSTRWLFIISCALAGGMAQAAAGQATTNPAPAGTPAKPTAPATPVPRPAPASAWWNDAVFYEVFVRSFADSTAGPLAADGVGDLAGLIERLDYLNDGDPATTTDLGVTGLWLMPVTESPSYHGYDTTDYLKVERDYGTNENFQRLMVACKARGIRVIIDLVLNHHSSRHPWFTRAIDPQSPFHDWYIWRQERPTFKGPWNQTVWHATARNAPGPFYYGCFGGDMPDLNYTNPAVTGAMNDVVRFWLTEMGVDGFRLDAIRHLIEDGPVQENTPATHAWLRDFRTHVRTLAPGAFTVGEVWAPSTEASPYVGEELDTVFEFELADAILTSVASGDAARLNTALRNVTALYPENQFCTFLTNHDQPRVMTRLLAAAKGDQEVARQSAVLAAALLFTLPGVPFVYYGEELGMKGDKPDPDIRTPMQWTAEPGAGFSTAKPWRAVNADARTVNVAAQTATGSLAHFYRELIRFRTTESPLRRGSCIVEQTTAPGVLIFHRIHGEFLDTVVVNLSGSEVERHKLSDAKRPAGFDRPAADDAAGVVLCAGGKPNMTPLDGQGARVIPPRSVTVLRSRR